MPLITIITPTYNRANTLGKLYASLSIQKHNFYWLIVDDGSIDDTEELVQSFIKNADFKIKYLKKQNGGKHSALNIGIKNIETILTIIVDSDDQLLPGATELIEEKYNKYKENKTIGFFTFLKCFSDGKPIVKLDRDEFLANYIKYRIKEERPGDTAEVFYTKVLRDHPFPEFIGERFLSEDIVWIEISKKYDSLYINKVIYECEYLKSGLTNNDKPVKFASPLGSMMRGKQLMSKECGLKMNIKGAIIYNCYKIETDKKISDKVNLTGIQFFLVAITKPLGKIYYKKWRR